MQKRNNDPKLRDLEEKLKAAKARGAQPSKKHQSKLDASIAYRIIIDLFAGLLVGGFLGYMLDTYAHTKPFGMVIGLLLGAIGGFYTVFKSIT